MTNRSTAKKSPKFSAEEIERVYQSYPRKVARGAALKAIAKALGIISERGTPRAAEWLLDRVHKYAPSVAGCERRYIPHPATWMNGARYDDDPNEWAKTSGSNRTSREFPEPPKATPRLN